MKRRAFLWSLASGLLSAAAAARAGLKNAGPLPKGRAVAALGPGPEILPFARKTQIAPDLYVLTDRAAFEAGDNVRVGFLVLSQAGFKKNAVVRVLLPRLVQYRPWSRAQAWDPAGEGYTSIRLNGKDITKQARDRFTSGYGNGAGFFQYAFDKDAAGPALLEIVYGDWSLRGPGARAQEIAIKNTTLGCKPIRVLVLENGTPAREGVFSFDTLPGPPETLDARARLTGSGPGAALVLSAARLDRRGNPVSVWSRTGPLSALTDRAKDGGLSTLDASHKAGLAPGTTKGVLRFRLLDSKPGLGALCNPVFTDKSLFGGYSVFFGDLHAHCANISPDALGGFDDVFLHARDAAGLDFAAITDHAELFEPQSWKACLEKTEKYNEPGRFVTFPGFEWTSNAAFGHRTVIFRDAATATPVSSVDRGKRQLFAKDPTALWKILAGREALTTPHNPRPSAAQIRRMASRYLAGHVGVAPGPDLEAFTERAVLEDPEHMANWSFYNKDFQRLVEVTSRWAEYGRETANAPYVEELEDIEARPNGVQEALRRGQVLGFIGGSDNHAARPGQGGVAGVLARDRSRAGIWEALVARRTFAATAPGIACVFWADHGLMGSQVKARGRVSLSLRVFGTTLIRRVEIVRLDGRSLKTIHLDFPMSLDAEVSLKDAPETGGPTVYYARMVQEDGQRAWSSPVYVYA